MSNQHRYRTLDQYLKQRYGQKVFKIALNGDFTCPNRDGTISTRGCLFCSAEGSGDFAGKRGEALAAQFASVRRMMHQKWPEAYYIIYFQANTNTYGPLEKLKNLFEEAMKLDEKIVALSIATRCDCLPPNVLAYLEELNRRIPIWVELGLQTIHQRTMEYLNLGYDLETFAEAVKNLRSRGISTIVHIINGLPGENKEMMLETASYLNKLDIQGIKIHSLFILKNTVLGKMYQEEPFPLLSLEEYVDIVCEQLAILRENIVIHRINGDAPQGELLAPLWNVKKLVVMNEIDKMMKARNYHQGCKSK
jgi:radical SAM protein (TIGR01212 family)